MTTYNQIIKSFDTFCGLHKQIHSFHTGKTWNFQTYMDNEYPVIVTPLPSSITKGKISLSFSIIVTDILNKDRSNLDELYSDTLLIIADMVSYFQDEDETLGNMFWLDESSVSIEPFEEALDDVLAGWIMTANIDIRYNGTLCNIPLSLS